jgi:hypothetical protein
MRHILYLTTIFISLAGSAAESVDNPLRSEKEPLIYLSLEGGGMHMSAALELINLLEIE